MWVKRGRARRALLGGGAIVLALGGIAYATIPDSGHVYSACSLNNVGTIRLIDPSLPSANLTSHCTKLEKLITLAKRGDLHARRQALASLHNDKFVVHKLFEEVAPRYTERPGGYTRIIKLGPRKSDSTEMVFLELV